MDCPLAPATLSDIVRLYGLRMWVEQSVEQVKTTLGLYGKLEVNNRTAAVVCGRALHLLD